MKLRGCAIVIVGHRPSTLEQADKILVMSDGAMAQYGNRDDILRSWEENGDSQATADVARLQRPERQFPAEDGEVLLSVEAAE
jgi:ABC-type protease/lipase transport system fused ATPase/permease subunit